MSSNDVRLETRRKGSFSNPEMFNTAEYLSWRRLHLSKSKLTNVTEMASFMAGFAVVATVELQINDDDVRPPLLAAFVVTTSLLVGTCMIAITISTCVLPHLESVAKTSNISGANQSPHDKMQRLIDISWILTNSASLFFFTLDVILMCWIKYTYFTIGASIAATVIMAPVLIIILVFACLFYRRIVKHQYVISSMKYEELERMHKQLERASSLNSLSYQGTITSNHQAQGSLPSLKKQWMQQQQNRNHQQQGPSSPSPHSSQVPPPLPSPRFPQFPPYRNFQRHFSHPDQLPFNFSPHPGGYYVDPRSRFLPPAPPPPSDTPTTMPVSPAGSSRSLSPSVLTV